MTLSSTSLYASHKYGKYHCHIIAPDVKYITATVVSIALCFSSYCVVPNSLEFFCADSAAISYITGAQCYRILSCLFFSFSFPSSQSRVTDSTDRQNLSAPLRSHWLSCTKHLVIQWHFWWHDAAFCVSASWKILFLWFITNYNTNQVSYWSINIFLSSYSHLTTFQANGVS